MSAELDPDVFAPPGSMILTTIEGFTGRWVSAIQAFVRGGSLYTHAAISIGGGLMVEANPHGADVGYISRLHDGRPLLISDDPIQRFLDRPEIRGWKPGRAALETSIRETVSAHAVNLIGTPYGWLDYVALAALETGVPGQERLRRYVEDSGSLICSALVDRVYSRSGIELFDDGRYAGDVTPGDLDRWVRTARDGDLDPTKFTLRGGYP